MNLPFIADAAGANYVARWTVFHVRQVVRAIKEGLEHKGFSFVEIMSPCPTLYLRRNKLGDGVDQVRWFKEHSVMKNGVDTKDVALRPDVPIAVGKFVDRQAPTWQQARNAQLSAVLGSKFVMTGGSDGHN